MSLSRVVIHGPVLASLLHSAAQADQYHYDGLLFGYKSSERQQNLRDEAGPELVEHFSGVISDFLLCVGTCSFYDTLGGIQEQKLQELLSTGSRQPGCSRQLIGWISARSAGALRPSVREMNVSSSLGEALKRISVNGGSTLGTGQRSGAAAGGDTESSGSPLLFMLLSSGDDHNGATCTLQCRVFQQELTPGAVLHPVELVPLNLGAGKGAGGQGGKHPSVDVLGAHSPNLDKCVALAAAQVEELGDCHAGMIAQLEMLAGKLSEQTKVMEALQAENRSLAENVYGLNQQ